MIIDYLGFLRVIGVYSSDIYMDKNPSKGILRVVEYG